MGTFKRKVLDIFSKMDITWLSVILALITLATPASTSEPRVVCYYTNWSVYRPGTARFNPQNINPYLCTHLIYAFGGFTKDNNLKPFDKYQDIEKGGYAKFTGLKTYNKNLKTLLAIGGWNEGSSRFSPMVASKERRREFVRNAIKFLRQNRFDGLDLDWEYPAFRDGGKPKDRENYAKLVKELREEFEKEASKTGKPRLLLTMAVPAGIEYIQKGFDVKTLNTYLDWLNLLTYDYHSAFEPAVNHHAPLYPIEEPNEYSVDNELNIDYTIKFYLEHGADRDKLVLGIPTYGRSYTLFNPDATELGSPADGPGDQGDATREKGYLAYYEICESLKPKIKKRSIDSDEDEEEEEEQDVEDLPWNVMQPNPRAMGPFAYRGNQWVGYDDIDIVKKKAEYVAENGLGGIMFWSIDNDDFRGNCHGKPYPLIEASKEAYIAKLGSTDNVVVTDRPRLSSSGSSGSSGSSRRRDRLRTSTTSTTSKPSSAIKNQSNKRKNSLSVASTTPTWNIVTPEPPTTPDPGSDFKCTDEGFFQHPRDCKKYFWCLDSGPSNLGIVAHAFTCPSGLFFNKAADSCDFARNVLCKKPAATTKAPATTTSAPTTTSTTRKPIKLSTKNSQLFRTTTTTTTTTTPEPEEEYEEGLEDASGHVDSEDPKVIKELIDLIRKLGGVEQLEKQLHLSEGISNRKLYQKVLEKTRKSTVLTNSILGGGGQNSRRGPQNAGLEASSDKDKLLRKDRPQYTTINRARAASPTEEESVEQEEEEQREVPSPVPQRARVVPGEARQGTTPKALQYVNIRRARPSTSDTADDTASRNALFERSETYLPQSETSSPLPPRRDTLPDYVTIKRTRPSAEPATTPTTALFESAEEEESEASSSEKRSPAGSGPRYTSIERRPTPGEAPSSETPSTEPANDELSSKESPSSEAPATVLDVQISTLNNSPEPEIVEASSAEPSTASPSPTPSSTTPAPPATPARRVVSRRRGTTTTTPAPLSTTQAAKDRRNNFLRRTKATAPPDAAAALETDADSQNTIETTTSKYTRRANSRFKNRKSNAAKPPSEDAGTLERKEEKFENRTRQPSLVGSAARSERPTRNFVRRRLGGANVTTTTSKPSPSSSLSSPSSSPSPSSSTVSRRPFRVASRRRLAPASSTSPGTTTSTLRPSPSTDALSVEALQDISDNESIEDPSLQQRSSPKKTIKLQRRPLVTLKEEDKDQNPSATTEEESKRQSKKYSASIKQNQLDEVIRLRTKSQEESDVTTDGKTTADDISAETAVAIAAHQLLSAPLPSTTDFDDQKPTKKSTQVTREFKKTTTIYTEDFTASKTPSYSDDYSSTPLYQAAPLTGSLDYDTRKSSFPSPTFSKAYSSVRPSGYSTPTIVHPGLSGASSPRYLGTSNKYVSVPVEEYPYPTSGYPGLGQEPSYFTREYLLESPVTRTYDDEYQYLSPATTPQTTTRKTHKKTVFRRISTTIPPTTPVVSPLTSTTPRPRRGPKKPFEKIPKVTVQKQAFRPIENYDYYDDGDEKVVDRYSDGVKVVLHGKGSIECLDIGNFPHPSSCKKFISCARMEGGNIVGWEYICPVGLSYDPVGGMCNWSAGLGCDEKDI